MKNKITIFEEKMITFFAMVLVSGMAFSQKDPVLDLRFDNSAVDLSPLQHTLVSTNGQFAYGEDRHGKSDGALYLDGTNYFTIANHDSLNFGRAKGMRMTISLWYKELAGVISPASLIEKSPANVETSGEVDYSIFLTSTEGRNKPTNNLAFTTGYSVDTIASYSHTPKPAEDQWHHVVMKLKHDSLELGYKEVYIDGQLVAQGRYTKKGDVNTNVLTIGRNVKWKKYFKGYIDDVIIARSFKEDVITSTIASTNSNVEFTIYPNPANDRLYIQSSTTDNYNVVITDLAGQIILNLTNTSLENGIDVSSISSGMYIISVSLQNGQVVETKRIIIQN